MNKCLIVKVRKNLLSALSFIVLKQKFYDNWNKEVFQNVKTNKFLALNQIGF